MVPAVYGSIWRQTRLHQYTQFRLLPWICLLRMVLLKGHFYPQSPRHTNSHKDGSWASMVVHNHPSAILLLKDIGGHSPA